MSRHAISIVDEFAGARIPIIAGIVAVVAALSGVHASEGFQFKHHFGDADIDGENLAFTALADFDADGDLDFAMGMRFKDIYWYEYRAADDWVKHRLGGTANLGIGAAALDVNKDGRIDLVTGGAWYENPRTPRTQVFIRHIYDSDLINNHDVVIGDVSGDGQPDVVTMSDKNDVRWYSISDDPSKPWSMTHVGESVHAGISLGDIDDDGDLDIVRSNIWFENLGQGKSWEAHKMTEPWGAEYPEFAVNATRTAPVDLNDDGRLDVVIVDNENPHAKSAWLESPSDPREGTWIAHPLPRQDEAFLGALHSLKLADFDNDGRSDIFTVEMERFPGARPPRWFIWKNLGKGKLEQHVILNANLGGHETVVGDVDADGDIDICSKPWAASETNALGGKAHFSYLENLLIP